MAAAIALRSDYKSTIEDVGSNRPSFARHASLRDRSA